MKGSWKWNAGFAFVGSVLTLTLALAQNTLYTSLIRSGGVFLLLFLIAYIPRMVLARVQVVPLAEDTGGPEEPEQQPEPKVEQQRQQAKDGEDFEPLTFPSPDVAAVTRTVRQWTKE